MTKQKSDNEGEISGFILGMTAGASIFLVIIGLLGVNFSVSSSDLIISNETALDICKNLTNQTNIIPSSEEGKLICTLPSYDHTQNIVIKTNGDRK